MRLGVQISSAAGSSNLGCRFQVDRARAVAGLFEAGKVKIRMGATWYDDLVQEFLAFPNGRNDDIVDAVCMGLAVPAREYRAHANVDAIPHAVATA